MTTKQWTAIGSAAAVVSLGVMLVQSPAKTLTVSGGNAGTINANSTIVTQNNVYMNQVDPSVENPRPDGLAGLKGEALISAWFVTMNEGRWRDGCSLHAKEKCDVSDGGQVIEHSREPRSKTVDGYKDVLVWHDASAPGSTWCVKYKYQERQSTVLRDIVLIMQYKLTPRSDGGEEIASRVCEKKWVSGPGGGERPCGAPASIRYCLQPPAIL